MPAVPTGLPGMWADMQARNAEKARKARQAEAGRMILAAGEAERLHREAQAEQFARAMRARRPGAPVDPQRMMDELAQGADAIEAKRKARTRRNAASADRALRLYTDGRERLYGDTRGTSPAVAAMLGLGDGGRAEVF